MPLNMQHKRLYLLFLLLLFNLTSLTAHAATPIAHYSFDETNWRQTGTVIDNVGSYNGNITGSIARNSASSPTAHTNTCASATFGGGAIDISGLPVSTSNGAKTSVSFWMYWDGSNSVMPLGWQRHDLWFSSGKFGFNTANSDIYGVTSNGLANGWHHIVAIFTNNDVTQNELYIDGTQQVLSQQQSTPNNSLAVVQSNLRLGGWLANNGYRFSGLIDEVKIYNGALTQADINQDLNYTHVGTCPADPLPQPEQLIAQYNFNDNWSATQPLSDSIGSANGIISGQVSRVLSPSSDAKPDTCTAGQFAGGAIDINNLPVSITTGDKTSVSFWMYWDGTNGIMPLGWQIHDLWLVNGHFGFNTGGGDIYGISSSGLANSWYHIAAVFTNNNVLDNKIYIDGIEQTLTHRRGTIRNTVAVVNPHLRIGGWWINNGYRFRGKLDELKIYTGEITQATVDSNRTTASSCAPLATWHMDKTNWTGTSNEVIDSSGHNYHGTASNGAQTHLSNPAIVGNPGSCAYGQFDGNQRFGGTKQKVTVPYNSELNPDSFTVAFWAKVEGDNNYWRAPITSRNSRASTGFNVYADNNNKWAFWTGKGTGTHSFSKLTSTTVTNNVWTHVAVSFDKQSTLPSGVLKGIKNIYINGILVNTANNKKYKPNTTTALFLGASYKHNRNDFFFNGAVDEVKLFDSALSDSQILAIKNETHPCTNTIQAANFNCVATNTDPVSGTLFTQRVNQSFTFDVVALNDDAPATVETHFANTVDVELVDASSGSCITYPSVIPSQPLTFNLADSGVKPTATPITVTKAYRNLKCRVTDITSGTPVVGCSTDAFAIRPEKFTLSSPLNNTTNSGSPKTKAGADFSLTATTATLNYDGTPVIDPANITAHTGANQIGSLVGSFPSADPASGSSTGTQFAYSEVGSFTINPEGVIDTTFTAVDHAGDCVRNSTLNTADVTGKIGCDIANLVDSHTIGRFTPDHFSLINSSITPACNTFSYMDEVFTMNYTLEARNTSNILTKNYRYSATSSQNYVKTSNIPITAEYVDPAVNASTDLSSRISMLYDPTNWLNGTYAITNGNTIFTRLSNAVDGAYDGLNIGLKVIDSDGIVLESPDMLSSDNTNASCTVANCLENKLDNSNIRYGRLVISNAHGSELLPLNMPFSTEYFNGLNWSINTADSCTTISTTSNLSYSPHLLGATPTHTPSTLAFTNGASTLTFAAASENNTGYIDITGSLNSWLLFDWNGDGIYNDNPTSRATFGIFKGNDTIIFRREVY